MRYTTTPFQTINQGKKSEIKEFSRKSIGSIRRYLRSCTADYSYLGTLTYPDEFPSDGRVFKIHLARFLQVYRRNFDKHVRTDSTEKFSVFWFLEFQQRGAPHFHFFATHAPFIKGNSDLPKSELIKLQREWIADKWYKIVSSGDERHLRAGTQFDPLRAGRGGTIKYATKYALKQTQKKVPECITNVGRFWGVSGWRHCLSATWVVSDANGRSKQCQEAIKKLYFKMRVLELDNKIDIKRDRHGQIRGWYCKTQEGHRRMLGAFRILESTMLLKKILDAGLYDQDIPSEYDDMWELDVDEDEWLRNAD